MSTYTEEQEIAMAKSCIWYRENSPLTYGQFLMCLSFMTGEHPNVLNEKIDALASK